MKYILKKQKRNGFVGYAKGRQKMKKENWKRKKKEEIEEEFGKLAFNITRQGATEILINLISFKSQKDFVIDWHSKDELDQ